MKILRIAFLASLVSAVVSTTLLYKSLSGSRETKPSAILEQVQTHIPKEPDKTSFNILLMGYGGAGHSGGGLADAILLANVNTLTKVVNLIAVPRDIWIENMKINSAFAESAVKAKSVVEKVTGLPVDYYAAIDFSRFERAIDVLGGITVDVPVAFTDRFYPIKGEENNLCDYALEQVEQFKAQFSGFELEKQFACRYETLNFRQESTPMNGATALKFVRSRHAAEHGGDFARGVRQQAVLTAARNKLISLDVLKNIDEFFAEFSKLIVSDVDEEDVIEILSLTGNPSEYTSKNINISADNYLQSSVSLDGQYILIPKAGSGNWQEVHGFIKSEIK
jgi:anionic cell wall polymer biosynthesis LytR-Cps2A-Psr (LCP) family protein